MKKVAFLLGAGTSIPVEMPDTKQITKALLSGNRISWNSGDESFVPHKQPREPDEYVRRVQKFLALLKDMIDTYYPDRDTNYEDLYYAADQIHGSESWDYDNPAVRPFVENVRLKCENLVTPNVSLLRLTGDATDYITNTVFFELEARETRIDHLRCITDACFDQKIEKVNICTLNHDKVLENALSKNDIEYCDGFEARVIGVRHWKPELFDNPEIKVRVPKLHRSVDWFRCRRAEGRRRYYNHLACIPGTDKWRVEDKDGKTWQKVEPWPGLSVGTLNKDLGYLRGINFTLYHHFFHFLDEVKHLIVSGYGFRDDGVSVRVLEWAQSNADRRVIVIDLEVDRLRNSMQY